MDRDLWLSRIHFNCPFKLTSKDKLVASYVLFAPIDVRADRFVRVVAKQSGLKERTVQKSFARLVAIGKVVLNADTTFTMGELL